MGLLKQAAKIPRWFKGTGGYVILLFLWGAFGSSCMVGPDYHTPASDLGPAWKANPPAAAAKSSRAPTNATNARNGLAEAYWWSHLNDPVLNQLVLVAWTNNLSLQSAGVRILQARAQLNYAIGNLFPQSQGGMASASYSRRGDLNPLESAGLSLASTWEIDLWGKYRRTIESDRASFFDTVASYDDALVSLIGQVATAYVTVRTTEEELRVTRKNVQLQEESERVTRVQFQYGENDELDVRQSESELEQTRSQVPVLQNALTQGKNSLSLLLGLKPGEVDPLVGGTNDIPSVPATIAETGIPYDLLRRRPDVRAAAFAAAAQSALIGVAKANLYPSLSISGSFGFSTDNLGRDSMAQLFNWQSRMVQGSGSVFMPILNYGRLENLVRVQDAAFQQAILNYQNTVLAAQEEVENNLTAFYTEQRALTNLIAAATAAERATDLAMIQYKAGEVDYTTVLTTQQAQLAAENAVVAARGSMVLDFISVYVALGGGWEIREGHDVISDAIKAEMARRTDWGRMLETKNHLPKDSDYSKLEP